MGSLLSRSSSREDMKVGKERRKRRYQHDRSFESDSYFTYDRNENEDLYSNFVNTSEAWDKEYDQQKLVNMNDSLGARSSYPSKYPVTQNNILDHSWSSAHDVNNSYYTLNSHQTAPSYNMPYIDNQYNHVQIPHTINNQSKQVQFSSSPQQQTLPLKPLVSTDSRHESNNMSVSTTVKPVPLSNRPSPLRPTTSILKISSTKTPVEKPVYIGIDYDATMTKRNEIIANKRHRKNWENDHFDGLNSSSTNHRIRSHSNQPHKHRTSTDSPKGSVNLLSNKSFDSPQPKSSPSQRTIAKAISIQNIQQIPSNEIKPLKSRNKRRQQSSVNNETKNQENQRRHASILSNESSLKTQSSTRRIENKQSNASVMRTPFFQFNHQNQKQPLIQSVPTTTTSFTRTRI